MASMQKVENIYEKLIAFDGPYTDRFLPLLAEEVPSLKMVGFPLMAKPIRLNCAKDQIISRWRLDAGRR
jgi:hypothetical protein